MVFAVLMSIGDCLNPVILWFYYNNYFLSKKNDFIDFTLKGLLRGKCMDNGHGASLREQIRAIYQDASLSQREKALRVQALHNPGVKKTEEKKKECTHYKRHCDIFAECCKKWYGCRLCHDEAEDHKIDRFTTTLIRCRSCTTSQAVSNQCTKCEQVFGESFCAKCRLWTTGQMYHCDKCGFCRKGDPSTFEHCDTCNACMAIGHQCSSNADVENNCPVCLERLFDSVKPWSLTKCGHCIHSACLTAQLEKGIYQCPICKKSLVDMSRAWEAMATEVAAVQMPEEYRDMEVCVQCNDCQETSQVHFHVIGMQCKSCSSFNTARV
jgi:RING finger/CHY zinc finger protein 1